jgi:hypothetical protein
MGGPFERVGPEAVRLTVSGEELELLRNLPGQLGDVLGEGDADPAAARLFPPAYDDPADADAAAEYRRLMQDELLRGKLAAVETVRATLERAAKLRGARWSIDLDQDETQAWLGVLNDLRLTLGVRLGVTDDLDGEVDDDDPRAPGFHLLYYLGWLEEHLLTQLEP